MKTLLIGGARSGKSSLAVRWAGERSGDVCCVVTANVGDSAMAARVAAHRLERPAGWRTCEAPVRLGRAVREEAAGGALLLIDCLTLWTANCLWPAAAAETGEPDMTGWRCERDDLLQSLSEHSGQMLIVSNEVGTGIVPANAAARLFRDEHGWLNQAVAAVCEQVFLVTAGLPLRLKPGG